MKNEVYIIISTPRSGSTFLASAIAYAGGEFGLPKVNSWDRASGEFEHPLLVASYKYLKRIHQYKSYSDTFARLNERKLLKNLKKLFEQVRFAKFPPLSYMLPFYIAKAGFDVKVIVSYRQFEDYAQSMMIKNGISYTQAKDAYLETYRNAVMLLNIYGGCAISYEEITSDSERDWCMALESQCQLDAGSIQEYRRMYSKPFTKKNLISLPDPACDALYEKLNAFKGRVFGAERRKVYTAQLS